MVDQAITTVFNDIYYSTQKKVLVYITSKCGNPSDISDIFQDTYTEIFSVLNRRGENYIENSEAFAINIAKQKIYKYYTLLEKLKKLVPILVKDSDGEEYDIVDMVPTEISIEDKLVDDALISEVNRHLSKKSDSVRRVFYLHYTMGLTIAEIASELNLTESNVKNKLYRTLSELQSKFQN